MYACSLFIDSVQQRKKLAGYWAPHLTAIKLVNISVLRYSKQIELINFLRT